MVLFFCAVFCLGIAVSVAQQNDSKAKDPQSADASGSIPPEEAAKKNPVKRTVEGFGQAKKLYGYRCAMCHGENGDGKGDLAIPMKLDLQDWRVPGRFPNSRMVNSSTSLPMAAGK
jgi:cytochrome c5